MGASVASATGLTTAEVAERIARGETNAFRAHTSRSAWSIIRANVFTLFNAIVAACFLVLLLIGRWQDALFGVGAIANTIIGSRAGVPREALARQARAHARAARAGAAATAASRRSPSPTWCSDDILVLRAGDQVAADAVGRDVRTRCRSTSPCSRASPTRSTRPAATRVLSGSIVVGGEAARAVVDKVGADSFANKLSSEAKQFSLVASELRSSINRVLGWVAWIIGPISLLVLNAQMVAAGRMGGGDRGRRVAGCRGRDRSRRSSR